MNSSNNLIIEQKIDEILFNFSNSGDYIAMGLIESRYKIVSEKAKQQLLSLIQEEKNEAYDRGVKDELNCVESFPQDHPQLFKIYRLQALKQPKGGTK